MSAYTNCNLALQKEPEQDKKNESKIFEIGHIFKTLLREKKYYLGLSTIQIKDLVFLMGFFFRSFHLAGE